MSDDGSIQKFDLLVAELEQIAKANNMVIEHGVRIMQISESLRKEGVAKGMGCSCPCHDDGNLCLECCEGRPCIRSITDEVAGRISSKLQDWHNAWRYAYHLSPGVLKSILSEELFGTETSIGKVIYEK